MNIVLENLDEDKYKYDVEMLVNSFFPKRDQESEEQISLVIERKADEVSAFLRRDNMDCDEVSCIWEEKDGKNLIKQIIYKVLVTYTAKELPWGILTGIRPTKLAMAMLEENNACTDEEIRELLMEYYYVSEEKTKLAIDIARREKDILKEIDYKDGYSLYIGIPFCPSTCLYCSFTSYPIGMYKDRTDRYVECLIKEIEYSGKKFRNKKLNTVYFGGGTPTTLSPKQLDRVFTAIENNFDLSYVQEYTVEAGRPDSITEEKLKVLKAHRVTRISVNPQTMKQETLDIIGRRHTVQQVKDAFLLARGLGFDNINMDFIVGLPNETIEDVRDTMEQVMELNPDSITVHSLAIKRAARLNMFKDKYKEMTIENNQLIMKLCSEYAEKLNMKPYYLYRQKNMAGNMENVGYSRDGAAGIYNILIMEEKQTILALGAGSITKYVFPEGGRIERCDNVKSVDHYMDRIDEMIERKEKFIDTCHME